MITHKEAEAMFRRCRNQDCGYKLTNNTRIQKRGRAYAVRLHETDIVIIRPDGTYRINSGGWRTKTTKDRMNRILPCNISLTNFVWHIGDDMYTDGMLIGSDGKPGTKTEPIVGVFRIKKDVDYYCNKFVRLATMACVSRDMRRWDYYKRYTAPNVSNTSHITKLWKDINDACWIKATEWQADPIRFVKWVQIATVARGHGDPKLVWSIISNESIRGIKSHWVRDNLRKFIRDRKSLIIDQIVHGDLILRKRIV